MQTASIYEELHESVWRKPMFNELSNNITVRQWTDSEGK